MSFTLEPEPLLSLNTSLKVKTSNYRYLMANLRSKIRVDVNFPFQVLPVR